MTDQNEALYVSLAEKPEGVPDKFWNSEKGLNVSGMASAYSTLESSRESFKAETEAQLRAQLAEELAPKAPERYELPKIEAAPGIPLELENDVQLGLIERSAAEANLTQEQFGKLAENYANDKLARLRATGEDARNLLGDKAADRTNVVAAKVKALVGDELYASLDAAITEPRAVLALEKLVNDVAPPQSAGEAGAAQGDTEDKIKRDMLDDRYSHPIKRDPAYVAEITARWNKLLGDQKANVDGTVG